MLLSIDQVKESQRKGYQILDVRSQDDFAISHIPLSLNIPLLDSFLSQSKEFITPDQAIVLITEKGKEKYALEKIEAFGFYNIVGCLSGGFEAWLIAKQKIDVVISISAEELLLELEFGKIEVFDLRKPASYKKQHIENSENVNISTLIKEADDLDDTILKCIVCENGVNSMTIISYLKTHGKHNIYHISGGFASILENSDFDLVCTKEIKKTNINN